MTSKRYRSRKTFSTRFSKVSTSVSTVEGTAVPQTIGQQEVTDDALVQGAVIAQSISPGAVESTAFGLSAYIPSGETNQRVPAPLTDTSYWSKVIDGQIELHRSGIHGIGNDLEDIQHVEASLSGLTFTPTADEDARIYLTGRMDIPPSRKIYATWMSDFDVPIKLVWWKTAAPFQIESAKMVNGIATLNFNTLDHTFVPGNVIKVEGCGKDFDGTHTVLAVAADLVSYIPSIDTLTTDVVTANFVAATKTATLQLTNATGFDIDGYLYLHGVGDPFNGIHQITSVSGNNITFTIDYDTDTSGAYSLAGATLYRVDQTMTINEDYLNPFGVATLDTYFYVNLEDREIWGADGYTMRITNKSLTSNVITLEAATPTYLRVGDFVRVVGVDSDPAAQVFNTTDASGYDTVTWVSADTHSFRYARTASDVPSTKVTSASSYVITKNQDVPYEYAVYAEVPKGTLITPTLLSAKVFEVLGGSKTQAKFDTISYSRLVNNLATIQITNTAGIAKESSMVVAGLESVYNGTFTVRDFGSTSITQTSLTNNVATFTVVNTAAFFVGANVVISGAESPYNGTFTISAINNTSNTVSIALTYANITANTNSTATLQANTITYTITAANVAENLSAAGYLTVYSGVQHSELTPTGLTLYNADGSISARLSSQDINTLTIGDDGTGAKATITETGDASFADTSVDSLTSGDLTVQGNAVISGTTTLGDTAYVGSDLYLKSGLRSNADTTVSYNLLGGVDGARYHVIDSNSSTAVALTNTWAYYDGDILSRFARGLIYQVKYPGPSTSGTVLTSQFTTFAAGSFVLEPSRNYMFVVTTGTMRGYSTTNVNSRFEFIVGRPNDGQAGLTNAAGLNLTYNSWAGSSTALKHSINQGPSTYPQLVDMVMTYTSTSAPATVTNATVAGSVFIYTANNGFVAGHKVTITGVSSTSNPNANANAGFNLINATISSANSTHFTTAGSGSDTFNSNSNAIATTATGAADGFSNPYVDANQEIFWALRYSYQTTARSGNVGIDDEGGSPGNRTVSIYDMGPAHTGSIGNIGGDGTGTTIWRTTGNSTPTTNTNTNTTTTITKSVIIAATASAYFDNYGLGDGGTSDPYANEQSMYQGNPGTASGIKKSQVAFGLLNAGTLGVPSTAIGYTSSTATNGYTITKIELYLRNRHSASASGLTTYWGVSANSSPRSRTSIPASISSSGVSAVWFNKGQGKYTTLGSTHRNLFAYGTARSILLGITSATGNASTDSYTSSEYGYYDGKLQSDPPKLRVTLTYQIPA